MSIRDHIAGLLERTGILDPAEDQLEPSSSIDDRRPPAGRQVDVGAQESVRPDRSSDTADVDAAAHAAGHAAGNRADKIDPPPSSLVSQVVVSHEKDGSLSIHVLASARGNPQFLTYCHQLARDGHRIRIHAVDSRKLQSLAAENRDTNPFERGGQRIQTLIRSIFEDAAGRGASDIHIELRGDYCSVAFRVDGHLNVVNEYSRADGAALQRAIYQGYSKGDASYTPHIYQAAQIKHADDISADVVPKSVEALRLQRGPLHPDGEFTVLRLLYRNRRRASSPASKAGKGGAPVGLEAGLKVFMDFGYTDDQAMALARAARAPEGLVIFSGPTGSAKSSALKAALEFQHVLYPQKSIFTIEDPPEYEIEGAKQLAVLNAQGEQARKSGFSEALRVALRSDPDILMVGEIRDEATAGAALDAVITGHQMWSTVHAMDPYLIVTRLLRFGLDARDFLDATILRALVGQRLIGVVCDHCAVPLRGNERMLDEDIMDAIRRLCIRNHMSPDQIRLRAPEREAEKCKHCNGTGIGGRRVVAEVVEVDDEFISIVRGDDGIDGARAWKRSRPGHVSMLRHAIWRMFAGEADPREVIAVVGDLNSEAPEDTAITAEQQDALNRMLAR